MIAALPPNPTGMQLVDAIRAGAIERSLSTKMFALPLSAYPLRWLDQVAAAERPKPATIDRVRALLEGRDVPPPPANHFQASPRATPAYVAASDPPVPAGVARVDRDPCIRCGVRGDIGCEHRRP